jgi:hypothetical protein
MIYLTAIGLTPRGSSTTHIIPRRNIQTGAKLGQIYQRTWELGSTMIFQWSELPIFKVVVIYNLIL